MALLHKTIWTDEKEADSENNTLVVRIERMQKNGEKPKPVARHCIIEIVSVRDDDLGRPCKKRLKVNVDAALVSEIKDAMKAIAESNSFLTPFKQTSRETVQLSYEGKSPLIVMYEVPPHKTRSEMEDRYVIGDGADIRYMLGSFSDLESFHRELESALA
jgi:hypothetical protein